MMDSDGPGSSGGTTTANSKVWQIVLGKYYEELQKGGVRKSMIDKQLWNVHTPEDLVAQIESFAPPDETSSRSWSSLVAQLQPTLLGLNDFTAIITVALGMNNQVSVVLWGSIKLIIKVLFLIHTNASKHHEQCSTNGGDAKFAKPVFPEVVKMLGELQRCLPKIIPYEEELPMTNMLEEALVDMYVEVVIFCAHSITFFHNNPNINHVRGAWSQFSNDFSKVIKNLRQSARLVSEAADMVRLLRGTKTADNVAAIQGLQKLDTNRGNLPCYIVPYGLNLRFFGRSDEVQAVKDTLDPGGDRSEMRVLAIHGLAGVGKTQLALHYANTSLKTYQVIVWIGAETQTKLIQAISAFARKHGLIDNEAEDDHQVVQKVRDWFNTIDTPFLLIFDNVEDDSLLEQIWPASPEASVLITARSPSIAAQRTTKIVNLLPFGEDNAKSVLCSLTGVTSSDDSETGALDEICHLLGGLPLAFMHISTFIRDRCCSYEEFLRLFQKSGEKVFTRSQAPSGYDHTVLTTWNISISRLSPNASTLLNVLAFFDPDQILERLLIDPQAKGDGPRLDFLFDEFDFGDAVVDLIKASLVSRLATSKSLSMHRMVKLSILSKISSEDKIFYFENIVRILSCDFPNTWSSHEASQGHRDKSWEICGAILPHVSSLMTIETEYRIKLEKPNAWAELIFRSGTYLWEKQQPSLGRTFFEHGLKEDIGDSSPIVAQAYRLLGHISLDLARPKAALAAYEVSLGICQKLEEPESPAIANSYDSIACSHIEAGSVEEAFVYVEKATNIHLAHDPKKMARTEAIRALTCLRAGQADKSLEALRRCWELQGLTQEKVLQSEYPKHSGDIVLMARIKWAQGEKSDAQELASRTITVRRGIFGQHGGIRVADSTFIVARMLSEEGEDVLSAKMFRDIVDMCGDVRELKLHQARALWFLANAEDKLGNTQLALGLRDQAKESRDKIEGREGSDEDTDTGFMRLVCWMLW